MEKNIVEQTILSEDQARELTKLLNLQFRIFAAAKKLEDELAFEPVTLNEKEIDRNDRRPNSCSQLNDA